VTLQDGAWHNVGLCQELRIKLPRGRSLNGPLLASFEKEPDRPDGMMNNRGTARLSDATGSTGVRHISNR
jgi:hypothetical protein